MINETITLTAKPASGYTFKYWDFNYWPLDLSENTDKTLNPLAFINTFLKNDGFADNYSTPRTITAYFEPGNTPPQTPQNLKATDGTETGKVVISWDAAPGAISYILYWANSPQGDKSRLTQTSATSYTDSTVIDNNVYYYWVEAINPYGESAYSAWDSGFAYVDPYEPPPPPEYEPVDITPADAKQMLDTNKDVIVFDVSIPDDYKRNHILCAINSTWEDQFDQLDYRVIAGYKDYPVLVYDQDETNSRFAAERLAAKGFSKIYHMTGGLLQWMANGWETFDADHLYECSLPPMALAGQDIVVNEDQTITLDGSKSKASDGKPLTTYEWSQISGMTATIIDAASAEATFKSPSYVMPGGEELIFLLTVTDSQGNKDTDSVTIDVLWENSPPEADAGQTQSIPAGTTVILDGSASTDPDDNITAYQWKLISGLEEELELIDSDSKTARFTAPQLDVEEAELVFELTVTDNGGLSDTETVTIIVTRNNIPPVASAGSNQSVFETQPVQLDGSNSNDADDDIASYAWTQTGTGPTVQLSSISEVKPTFTAPTVISGSIVLEFQLTVTDASGVQSSDQVTIEVKDAGDPPRADAGTDQSPVYEGWQITLNGSASLDTDGEIKTYQWAQISGEPDVTLTGAQSVSPQFIAPTINDQSESVQLVFQLTVTDDKGLIGTDQVKIVVNKAMEAPTASAGLDQEIREGKEVVLDGSGSSDPDDGITHYSWRQTQGEPLVELTGSASTKATFLAPDVKTETILTFALSVTDYSGNEDTDEVMIRILPKSSGGGSCFISTLDL